MTGYPPQFATDSFVARLVLDTLGGSLVDPGDLGRSEPRVADLRLSDWGGAQCRRHRHRPDKGWSLAMSEARPPWSVVLVLPPGQPHRRRVDQHD